MLEVTAGPCRSVFHDTASLCRAPAACCCPCQTPLHKPADKPGIGYKAPEHPHCACHACTATVLKSCPITTLINNACVAPHPCHAHPNNMSPAAPKGWVCRLCSGAGCTQQTQGCTACPPSATVCDMLTTPPAPTPHNTHRHIPQQCVPPMQAAQPLPPCRGGGG